MTPFEPPLSPRSTTSLWAWARQEESEVLSPLSAEPMVDALVLTCGHTLAARDVAVMRMAGHPQCLSCMAPLAEDRFLVPSEPTRAAARLFAQLFADGLDLGTVSAPELARWASLAAHARQSPPATPRPPPPPACRPAPHGTAPRQLPPPVPQPSVCGPHAAAAAPDAHIDLASLFPGLTLSSPAASAVAPRFPGRPVPPPRRPHVRDAAAGPMAPRPADPLSAEQVLSLIDALDRALEVAISTGDLQTPSYRALTAARAHLIDASGGLTDDADFGQLCLAKLAAEAIEAGGWARAREHVVTWDRGEWTPTNRASRRAVLGVLRALTRASQPPPFGQRDAFDRLVRLLDALFMRPATRRDI